MYKKNCHKRPKDMRPIEMPLKSKEEPQVAKPEQGIERENSESIRNLRILLNKLSKENYARISDTILNNFAYNKEILEELTVWNIKN